MSIESTRKNYLGKWKYKGQEPLDQNGVKFDEIDLSISQDNVLLTLKFQGNAVDKRTFSGSAHFFDEYLLFTSSGNPKFFVRNATKEDMFCGVQRTMVAGDTIWQVKLSRK